MPEETILVVDSATGSRIRMALDVYGDHLANVPEGGVCRYVPERDQNCEGDSLETAKAKQEATKK